MRRAEGVLKKMLKTKEALIPYLLLAAAVVGGSLWHETQLLPGLGRTIATGQIAIGGPYALIDQDGRPRSGADFEGKYQLIYFGYSFCPDVCPTELALMAAAMDKLGLQQNRIVPIFISVDPARDTPSVLKKYLAAFGPRFVGLTGSPSALAQVEKEFRVYAKKEPLPGGSYSITHSSVIYLVGPTGKLVTFYSDETSPEDLAQDLKRRV